MSTCGKQSVSIIFMRRMGMVREAIAKQSEAILEQLEQNLEQLKSEMVEKCSLEL